MFNGRIRSSRSPVDDAHVDSTRRHVSGLCGFQDGDHIHDLGLKSLSLGLRELSSRISGCSNLSAMHMMPILDVSAGRRPIRCRKPWPWRQMQTEASQQAHGEEASRGVGSMHESYLTCFYGVFVHGMPAD